MKQFVSNAISKSKFGYLNSNKFIFLNNPLIKVKNSL